MVIGLWYNNGINFGSLSWFWRCKEHPCPLSPHLGLWRMLDVPDWGFASWSSFSYGQWSLIQPWSKFWLSILIFEVQRTSSLGAFEDTQGSWLGFWILILSWIWSLVFKTTFFQILALYLYPECAKNIHVLEVMIWSFLDDGCSWLGFGILILIWTWPLVFDTPMIQILPLYLDFEGAKNIHVI